MFLFYIIEQNNVQNGEVEGNMIRTSLIDNLKGVFFYPSPTNEVRG